MRIRLKEGVRFEDVRIEGMVVRRHASGTVYAYPKPVGRRRRAVAPEVGASMARVAALWAGVDRAGMEAWEAYGRVLHQKKPRPGGPMPAYNAFVKAMMAALAERPDAEPSLEPPFPPFRGDRIGIAVEALPARSNVDAREVAKRWKRAEDVTIPSPTVPPRAREESLASREGEGPWLQGEPSPEGEGALLITASYRNRTGVRTEVLARRLDGTTGATAGEAVRVWIGTFQTRSLTRTVALAAGAYEFEVRFVDAATGRATAAEALGTVVVEG